MLLWAISFLLLGVTLLGVEIVIPGFGVAGIAGICSLAASSVLFSSEFGSVAVSIFFITIVFFFVILFFILKKKNIFQKVILEENSIFIDKGTEALQGFVGQEGRTVTPLKPFGKAEINNRLLEVCTEGEYIKKNSLIHVFRVEGKNIYVKEVKMENKGV